MGVAGRCGASVISFAFWVQLWLRLCYGLEPWCFLGWKCCTKARGYVQVRMRQRMIP